MSNEYKIKKVDVTTNYFRFRQKPPSAYKNYRMKNLENGVKLVVGSE